MDTQWSASLLSTASTAKTLMYFVGAPANRSPQLLQMASHWLFLDMRVYASVNSSAFGRMDPEKRPTWIWGNLGKGFRVPECSLQGGSRQVLLVPEAGSPAGPVDVSVPGVGYGCRRARAGPCKACSPAGAPTVQACGHAALDPSFYLLSHSLQSCPTMCESIDGSPPGFPIPGILQARTLEWVAISFSNA